MLPAIDPTARRTVSMRLSASAILLAMSLFPFPARSETATTHAVEAAEPWSPFVAEAAERFAIPPVWIRAVMRIESNGNVKAVSPKGAIGLMQIMPDTYAGLRNRYDLGADPADPHDNIVAGAAYLREMYDRFGASGFLAAYNVGPARYDEHLATGRPLPDETRNYVEALTPLFAGTLPGDAANSTAVPRNWRSASLFVGRSTRASTDAHLAFTPQSAHIMPGHGAADLSAPAPPSGSLFVRKAPAQTHP